MNTLPTALYIPLFCACLLHLCPQITVSFPPEATLVEPVPPQVIHFDTGVSGASVLLQQTPSHKNTSAAFVARTSPPAQPVSIVAARGYSILRAYALVACGRQCGISANRPYGRFMKMISPTIVTVWKQKYKIQRIKAPMHQMQVAEASGSVTNDKIRR